MCFGVFFGPIFVLRSFRRGPSLKPVGHVIVLYKPQNMLDGILNFFLTIVNRVFGAFGGFFCRKIFFGE